MIEIRNDDDGNLAVYDDTEGVEVYFIREQIIALMMGWA